MLGPRKRRTCGCHSYYLYTFFLPFFFLHIRPVENVRHGGVMLRDCVREQQQKKRPRFGRLLRTDSNDSCFFYFLDFNHVSVELDKDTTRTRMYLLLSLSLCECPPFYHKIFAALLAV